MVDQNAVGRLDREAYEQAWNELLASFAVPPHEYLTYHKRRIYELLDHLSLYLNGKLSPRVLEIGMSPFSKLYKRFFPHMRLVTVDRPASLNGFDSAFAVGECGAEHHYNLDLNRESIGPAAGDPPLGQFDYVIFTEVLEHLVTSPIQLFGELLTLLKPNGLLYLTTPNFFAYYRLKQLLAGENPQGIFPRRGEDLDSAFHYREYTMLELIDLLNEAGGEIVKAYFSDCWDDPSAHLNLDETPQLRSELMVVACRAGAEIPHKNDVNEWRRYAKPTDFWVSTDNPLAQVEIMRLRQLVHGYESGRLMRLLKWLRTRRLLLF